MKRRDFLKLSSQAAGLSLAASALRPSLLMAQSLQPLGGKNVIFVNLLGGLDGLAAFPYSQSSLISIINNELRPNLGINTNSILQIGGQNGRAHQLGLNPAFQSLHSVASNNIKIIEGYGIPGDPGRSHDTCQLLMSMGLSALEGGDMVGFLARLMDHQNWETFQYWSLRSTVQPDTNSRKKPPIIVDDINSLDYFRVGWQNDADVEFSAAIQQELIEVSNPRGETGERYKNGLSLMHQTVARVRRDILNQPVGNNNVGDYDNSWFGMSLRDTAKILRAKAYAQSSGLGGRDTIILTAQDGYDTHSDQNNQGGGALGFRLQELATNLAVLYRDLENFGVINDTVIVLYSEFGRTTYQNGASGSATVGTDHGHASNTMILGGPVSAGVVGASPSANELRDNNYNALIPKVDFRDIFSDVVRWLGVNPSEIFDDSGYQPQNLSLLT